MTESACRANASISTRRSIALIGFGSQGKAWAHGLRRNGWDIGIFVRQGPSFQRALAEGFSPAPLEQLAHWLKASQTRLTAFLCPDALIGPIYREFLSSYQGETEIVLAHGFAVFSGQLQPALPQHHLNLLAPKAIGPQLEAHFDAAFPQPHDLKAAYLSNSTETAALAQALGFNPTHLIATSFEKETLGDLISEQGLLCGGVFTLLLWTLDAMKAANIPMRLVREECLNELELIAGLLARRGPASTFRSISEPAQAGTALMISHLEQSPLKAAFQAQIQSILDGRFNEEYQRGHWRAFAEKLDKRLSEWESQLGPFEG